MLAEIKGNAGSTLGRLSGESQGETRPQERRDASASGEGSRYRGARGLDPAVVAEIERAFGFDKPWQDRLWTMLSGYARFDLGRSLFRDKPVAELIVEKMPVSISLGLWSTLIIYLVSIPLGIRKAVRDGSRFDLWTSAVVLVGYAIPGFLFAIMLVVLFAGGSFLQWFPLRGLLSPGMEAASFAARALDYAWHMVLPTLALVIGGFAGLTMLTKNSFLEEIHKQYTVTAKAKGAGETRVLYGHVFRNAMLLIIAGFPAAFIGILFTGALLVEIIFSLDGLGLLGFESAIRRDYPVMFGTLYIFTLLGLVMQIVGDFAYTAGRPAHRLRGAPVSQP
ncbi:microcin C ABC transporter permease YejB [Dankookia sp. P2]|uniref:microcin C ABC transporter permease YejB n=1 Tax=Dankookia sp. P2 TaxID=3423955 RepID=UPI003D67B4B7